MSSLLYRSPDIVIDNHEWHVRVVRTPSGLVLKKFLWRPIGPPARMWQPTSAWQGRLPKGLNEFFKPFRFSIKVATGEVKLGTAKAA